MLNFTKTVRCSINRTAQQIDTKLTHPFENFRQNLLVNSYFMNDSNISGTPAETEKKFRLGFVMLQNIESIKPCHDILISAKIS